MVLPAVLLGGARVLGTVAQVAGRAGTVAARAGGTAARVGSTASRVGSTAARVGSEAESAAGAVSRLPGGGAGSKISKVQSGMRLASQGGRQLSTAGHSVTSAQPNSRMVHQASGAPSQYGYNRGSPNSPQQFGDDSHYGMSAAPMHSGYSGLDSAEATTGVPVRRDGFGTPPPLSGNSFGTKNSAMAWRAPSTYIGSGGQGSFFEFGEKSQGAPFQRPQG